MGSDVRPDVAYAELAAACRSSIRALDPDDFALAYALVHLSTLFGADLEERSIARAACRSPASG